MDESVTSQPAMRGAAMTARARQFEVARAFLRLGCISFGGPIAHLGYLRAEFVEKRKWLDDARYADIVALCQFLPGPASSQVVFALGMQRAGLIGAMIASLCFTLPSAVLMISFAYEVARAGDLSSAGWLHGLKLAAVAVVAQAVWGMGRKLCTDRVLSSLCVGAAALVIVAPTAAVQVGVIAFAGGVGCVLYRSRVSVAADTAELQGGRGHLAAAAALVTFAILLIALPLLASATGFERIAMFDSFYRAGALVFGGGHVVLPLLRAEVVPRGWLSDAQFLAGYGAAQALPGPLFAFSAYLGTAMANVLRARPLVGAPVPSAWVNGLFCLFAIFLPAWLLIGGSLPFWQRLKSKRWAQAALMGANASVVGVLLAALYNPIILTSVHRPRDAAAALVAFAVLEHWRAPAWFVVVAMAGLGQWVLAA